MFSNLLIAWLLMAACVAVHASGLAMALRKLKRKPLMLEEGFLAATWVFVMVAGWTLLLHLTEIMIWAGFYVLQGCLPNLDTAFYFSAVTYTTTGYGDVVLPEEWRLLGAVEALTGILMCGWSTGFFFAVATSWRPHHKGAQPDPSSQGGSRAAA